ncbi:MAG: anthranilate phosphoribosyltransferase [Gammaproteobacteria bacterium]|jgi:anthranilate phosphoribosyltransferase|nr:anthranilate phosphoribosyltransferase [Gammaproteobacteria bacterium]
MDMPGAIAKVIAGEDLPHEEMLDVMDLIMSGEATDAQIGGFLVGLRIKGETIDEIRAGATVMRQLVTPVSTQRTNIVDTCGTGGSGSNKFNVSTASAFVAASVGVAVAKHGNRGASSKSGSADVLEAAGAELALEPEQVGRCVDTVGVGFLFAQRHHSAMKHAIGPRKEMIVRTIFNLLGPLTNPAGAKRQLIGVYDRQWVKPVAEVLKAMGSEHVMVVHSEDGLDEISIAAPTFIAELKGGEVREHQVSPSDFGMATGSLEGLVIEDSQQSLALVKQSLDGTHEDASNIVALNAGAAIYVSGMADTLVEGVKLARESISRGLATAKLEEFVAFTKSMSAPAAIVT